MRWKKGKERGEKKEKGEVYLRNADLQDKQGIWEREWWEMGSEGDGVVESSLRVEGVYISDIYVWKELVPDLANHVDECIKVRSEIRGGKKKRKRKEKKSQLSPDSYILSS